MNTSTAIAGLLIGLFAHTAHAQTISNLRVDRNVVNMGDEVYVVVEFEGPPSRYGIRLDFGNGNVRDIRVGDNGVLDFPLRLPHRYAQPGNYLIRVGGESLTRGLKSVGACSGSVRSLNVIVQDTSRPAAPAPVPTSVPPNAAPGYQQNVAAAYPQQGTNSYPVQPPAATAVPGSYAPPGVYPAQPQPMQAAPAQPGYPAYVQPSQAMAPYPPAAPPHAAPAGQQGPVASAYNPGQPAYAPQAPQVLAPAREARATPAHHRRRRWRKSRSRLRNLRRAGVKQGRPA